MSFLTGLALRRPAVTMMVIVLVIIGGVVSYQRLQRELFPELEFPNIFVVASYPSASPEAVARDVTGPIEDAIIGMTGLTEIRSESSENRSTVVATFQFGQDMEEIERTIEGNLNGVDFPPTVPDPYVSRITADTFPVMRLGVLGDRDIPSLQRVVDDLVLPPIDRVDGVFSTTVIGRSEERIHVSVDPQRLDELGMSINQVAGAIRDNNSSFPAGSIDGAEKSFPVRTSHEIGALDDLENLVVGFEQVEGGRRGQRPVLLSQVAQVELGTAKAASISRINGKPSLSIIVIKEPDANTVDVTEAALAGISGIPGLPEDVRIVTLTNDGPEVRESLGSLLNEGLWGLVFAVSVVFLFLLNVRPTLLRGLSITIRPTLIIGLSIPLSILTAVIIMYLAGINLNFMSLAGLAIAVGRVVDDSIVVLENIYRHIQAGEDRMTAAVEGAREVGAAIVSSTLTTVVVFIPLAFIQGLVGTFFTPFALTVSFALLASTLVALTAVPALGLLLLRRGDFGQDDPAPDRDTLMVRVYMPMLRWALAHKLLAILIAAAVTGASLGLTRVIPVTLFPSEAPEFLTVGAEMPTGTPPGRMFDLVLEIEGVLEDFRSRGIVDNYQSSIFGAQLELDASRTNVADFLVTLPADTPPDVEEQVRAAMPEAEGLTLTVSGIEAGPPEGELQVTVTGPNYSDIAAYARRLEAEIRSMDHVVNVSNNASEARDEVVVRIDPRRAGQYGISAASGGSQVNRYLVGQAVTEVELDGVTMDVVVRGDPGDADDIEKLKELPLFSSAPGQAGVVKLGAISDIAVEETPVTISHYNGDRSATITGTITTDDAGAVGRELQRRIDALERPPGVEVNTGGIFDQIAEGFADVFQAIAIGIALVYLVMVASLGSLRSPFVIVMSLPLALAGALTALFLTGRTLSLSAMMGLLLLIGVVVTNAIVLIVFVEQLRERGTATVYEALIEGSRVRLRPILMTAFTTTFALLPLAAFGGQDGGIIGAELATVVIGGLVSSTFLTLIVVPVVYTIVHESIPSLLRSIRRMLP